MDLFQDFITKLYVEIIWLIRARKEIEKIDDIFHEEMRKMYRSKIWPIPFAYDTTLLVGLTDVHAERR